MVCYHILESRKEQWGEYNNSPHFIMSRWNKDSGYVYILFDVGSGLTKIGSTSNYERRIKDIQTNNPTACEVFVFEVSGVISNKASHYRIEQLFHKMYKDKRLPWTGEWFVLTKTDVENLLKFSIGSDWESSKTRIEILYNEDDDVWDVMDKQRKEPYSIYPIKDRD